MSHILKKTQLGKTQSLTDEGFLLCEGVPIARCGTLLYGEHELSGLEGKAGLLRITRKPEDVFKPESIASFNGKPVIVTHAAGLVTPANWKEAVVGTVLNPRRGTGIDDDKLLADLLIMDQATIAEIRKQTEDEGRGPEVSAGYNADYEQTEPGFARQYNIMANHVALVDQGRCGTTCAIGDHAMAHPTKKPRSAARARLTADAIRRAFATRDQEMLEEALNDVQPGESGEPPADATGTGDPGSPGHSITVNIHGMGTGEPTVDTEEPDPNAPPADPTAGPAAPPAAASGAGVPPWAQALIDGMAAMAARLDAIEGAIAPDDAPEGEGEEMPEGEGDEPPAEGGEEAPDEGGAETKDSAESDEDEDKDKMKQPTMDSAGVSAMFRDTMARAEILAPGFKLPTFDGKRTASANFKTLCDARRRILAKALEDANTAKVIQPVVAGKDFGKLTCDSLGTVFMAASELVKATNNRKVSITATPRVFGSHSKVMTPAEINAANRAKFGYA